MRFDESADPLNQLCLPILNLPIPSPLNPANQRGLLLESSDGSTGDTRTRRPVSKVALAASSASTGKDERRELCDLWNGYSRSPISRPPPMKSGSRRGGGVSKE